MDQFSGGRSGGLSFAANKLGGNASVNVGVSLRTDVGGVELNGGSATGGTIRRMAAEGESAGHMNETARQSLNWTLSGIVSAGTSEQPEGALEFRLASVVIAAGETVRGHDVAAAVGGQSQGSQPALEERYVNFFERNYDAAAVEAAYRGVDATLLLGLAAYESGYGDSSPATDSNNPFGATPRGPALTFKSLSEAWQWWGKTWGPRVQYVGSDAEEFVRRLSLDNRTIVGPTIGGDRWGSYNTVNHENWVIGVPGTIEGVQQRLSQWQGYGP